MNLGAILFNKNNLIAPGIIITKPNNKHHIAIKKKKKKSIHPIAIIILNLNCLERKSKKF